jgi:hypothetical protein
MKHIPPPAYRGVYINNFLEILGDTRKEDSLLVWCVENGFNAISLYDLNTVMADERFSSLGRFIRKTRSVYGIDQVAAVRGSRRNFIQNARYDASRTDKNERFTVYNLENEWWNSDDCDFNCFVGHMKSMRSTQAGLEKPVIAEAYIGWFRNPAGQEMQQADSLVHWLDRIMVHAYRSIPQLSYMQDRLEFLGKAAKKQNKVMDVILLFSAESDVMFDYYSETGDNYTFDDAYADMVLQFNAAQFEGKSNIRIVGYQVFAYTWAKAARPTVPTLPRMW